MKMKARAEETALENERIVETRRKEMERKNRERVIAMEEKRVRKLEENRIISE